LVTVVVHGDAAARGDDTGKDTKAGMPRKAPSGPRAASRAGRRPRAFRRPQRGSAAKLRAFTGRPPASSQARAKAVVHGETLPLKAGTLVLIQRGDTHDIRNTGDGPLRTLNVYVPPAFTEDGEGLPGCRKGPRGGARTEGAACLAVWHGDVVGDRPDRTVPRQLCWPGPGLPGSRGLLSAPERWGRVRSASDSRQPRLRSPC